VDAAWWDDRTPAGTARVPAGAGCLLLDRLHDFACLCVSLGLRLRRRLFRRQRRRSRRFGAGIGLERRRRERARPDQVEAHGVAHAIAQCGRRDLPGIVDRLGAPDVPACLRIDQRVQAFHTPAAVDEAGQVVAVADDVAMVVDAGAGAEALRAGGAGVDVDQAAIAVQESRLVVQGASGHRRVAGHLAAVVDVEPAGGEEAEVSEVTHRTPGPEEGRVLDFGEDELPRLAGDLVAVVERPGIGDRVLGGQAAEIGTGAAGRAQEAGIRRCVRGARVADRGGIAGVVDVGEAGAQARDDADVARLAVGVDIAAALAALRRPVAEHLALVVDGDRRTRAAAERADVHQALAAIQESMGDRGAERTGTDHHAGIVDIGASLLAGPTTVTRYSG
jgi:hypothetical protein